MTSRFRTKARRPHRDIRKFQLWHDFSIRMARTCYAKWTERRRQKLIDYVTNIIDSIQEERLLYIEECKSKSKQPETLRWDNKPYPFEVCQEMMSEVTHYDRNGCSRVTSFETTVNCCVRAGCDVVCSDVGVLGYTFGDLRAMYDGRVPRWLKDRYINFDQMPDNRDALL